MSIISPAIWGAFAGFFLALVENFLLGVYLQAKKSTTSPARRFNLLIKARSALILFPFLGYIIGSKVV